jgi:tRNA-specific 2-thiouridylase
MVALSGGIDSGLAAALLKGEGWVVQGLHFLLPASPPIKAARLKSVQKISHHLDLPVETVDMEAWFRTRVIEPFLRDYLNGRTPNPCITCNEQIKFTHLLHRADRAGVDFIATGHYARLKRTAPDSPVQLLRGKDPAKEQSYFLHRLTQAHLSRTLFPLGGMTKADTRNLTQEMGLPAAHIPESQEICFIPDNDYRCFIENHKGTGVSRSGPILDGDGRILGEHMGTYRFTIGQRKGLGIASSRPYYVKEIRPGTHEVVVGRKEDLYARHVAADNVNWLEGSPPQELTAIKAQVRYRHRAAPGRLGVLSPGRIRFTFDDPQWAVTPGQALVCYQGDRVLGGGWIQGD